MGEKYFPSFQVFGACYKSYTDFSNAVVTHNTKKVTVKYCIWRETRKTEWDPVLCPSKRLHLGVYTVQNTHKLQMFLWWRIISALGLYQETIHWTPLTLCSMYKGIPAFKMRKSSYHFRKGFSDYTPVIRQLQCVWGNLPCLSQQNTRRGKQGPWRQELASVSDMPP
jgi:hypothetical protein